MVLTKYWLGAGVWNFLESFITAIGLWKLLVHFALLKSWLRPKEGGLYCPGSTEYPLFSSRGNRFTLETKPPKPFLECDSWFSLRIDCVKEYLAGPGLSVNFEEWSNLCDPELKPLLSSLLITTVWYLLGIDADAAIRLWPKITWTVAGIQRVCKMAGGERLQKSFH